MYRYYQERLYLRPVAIAHTPPSRPISRVLTESRSVQLQLTRRAVLQLGTTVQHWVPHTGNEGRQSTEPTRPAATTLHNTDFRPLQKIRAIIRACTARLAWNTVARVTGSGQQYGSPAWVSDEGHQLEHLANLLLF